MAFTPDPETTWAAGFAGALTNPGIKLDLSSLIGKFDYNAAVFAYESTIGVQRCVEFNPTALFGMLGLTSKLLAGIASFAGNYQLRSIWSRMVGKDRGRGSTKRPTFSCSVRRNYRLTLSA